MGAAVGVEEGVGRGRGPQGKGERGMFLPQLELEEHVRLGAGRGEGGGWDCMVVRFL